MKTQEKEFENRAERVLPQAFAERMNRLLGEEAQAFFESYDKERRYGLRINPLKGNGVREAVLDAFSGLEPIPWTETGYFYEEEARPGKHPLHEAGAYYIQEPSAMAVAEELEPKPGERILDLCAAPGGKSTQLAGKMGQEGLLVCNEIHPARAKILSQNIERMGIGNAVVLNMAPGELVPFFPGFFDGIVVDAPCSGEGMFRKDETAVQEWSGARVSQCAERQDGILDCAATMVRGGGRIVYSTCTFAPEEDEQAVSRFLSRHPEFTLVRAKGEAFFSPGRPEWADGNLELKKTVRIWPHKAAGEGHFLAVLKKTGESGGDDARGREMAESAGEKTAVRLAGGCTKDDFAPGEKNGRTRREKGGKDRGGKGREKNGQQEAKRELEQMIAAFYAFAEEALSDTERLFSGRKFLAFGDNLYLVPEALPSLNGLKVLRPGLHLGTVKKGRLEPSQALAQFLRADEAKQTAELSTEEAARYLRGESLSAPEIKEKGWTLLTVSGLSAGWAKAVDGVLKNHYPKGLRRPY